MTDRFDRALPLVLAHEGGFVNHPRDPGGATNKGITIGTFRRYVPGATVADLRNISDAMVAQIYRDGYWNMVSADDLPAGLDYAVFDWAVNSGPRRAAIGLQRLVNVADDGVIGPITLAAVRSHGGVETLIKRYCAERLRFKRALSTWDAFGRGWTNRVNGVEREALKMVRDPAPIPPPPDVEPVPDKRDAASFWAALYEFLRKWFGG